MRKPRKKHHQRDDAALQALYQAAGRIYYQIQTKEEKVRELQAEIENLRTNALNPIEKLAQDRHAANERKLREWVSEPVNEAW